MDFLLNKKLYLPSLESVCIINVYEVCDSPLFPPSVRTSLSVDAKDSGHGGSDNKSTENMILYHFIFRLL